MPKGIALFFATIALFVAPFEKHTESLWPILVHRHRNISIDHCPHVAWLQGEHLDRDRLRI
jgi:hypothetical protein